MVEEHLVQPRKSRKRGARNKPAGKKAAVAQCLPCRHGEGQMWACQLCPRQSHHGTRKPRRVEEGPDDPDQTGTPATTGTETFGGFPKLGISSLERQTL